MDYLYGSVEKSAVILEFGALYTRCGFSGEAEPRCMIPTVFEHNGNRLSLTSFADSPCEGVVPQYGVDVWRPSLEIFLQKIYFEYLQTNPKERKVVICENIFSSSVFRDSLAYVLFERFHVPTLVFAYSQTSTLLPLSLTSGLVIDVGFSESRVIPVCEGIGLLTAHQTLSSRGVRAIHSQVKKGLGLGDLSPVTAEDIIFSFCFLEKSHSTITPIEPTQFPISSNNTITLSPEFKRTVATILFEEDDEGESLTTLILDALLKTPTDLRAKVCSHIIAVGGGARIAGFNRRLISTLKETVAKNSKYSTLEALSDYFRVVKSPYAPAFLSWVGGSILGCIDVLPLKVTKELYSKDRRLPDWASLNPQNPSHPSSLSNLGGIPLGVRMY